MNQKDLTRRIAGRFFLTKTESNEILQFIFSEITQALKKPHRVYFRRFGSFTQKTHKSKKVRHPKTGRIITLPERIWVRFKPSHFLLKDLIKPQNPILRLKPSLTPAKKPL